MKAMTVIASGYFGCIVGLAEHHGFAMIGFAVMFQPIFMAFATTLVAERFKVFTRGINDLVSTVTINADRSSCVPLSQQLAMNTFIVGFLDADVALATSLGHVGMING